MAEPAKVLEDREIGGQWRVERFDEWRWLRGRGLHRPDGASGCVRYAMRKYGNFREMQLEPYPPSHNPSAMSSQGA